MKSFNKIESRKKFTTIIVFMSLSFITINTGLNAETVLYFSPGISISWSKQTPVFGWKLSVGYFQEIYRDHVNGYFLNVTVGQNYGVDNDKYSYSYSEVESGISTGLLFSGLGFGTAYFKDDENKIKIVPKGSIFTGSLLFARSDYILYQSKLIFDVGGNLVLPINKYLIDSHHIGGYYIGD